MSAAWRRSAGARGPPAAGQSRARPVAPGGGARAVAAPTISPLARAPYKQRRTRAGKRHNGPTRFRERPVLRSAANRVRRRGLSACRGPSWPDVLALGGSPWSPCSPPSSLRPSHATAGADGAWLDQSPPTGWNVAGAAPIPPAPPTTRSSPIPAARRMARPPETDADRQVAGAGWTVSGDYRAGWGVQVVRGLALYDGMCRPLQYQEFVFVDGRFAGTISPSPMDSRTDGAGETEAIRSGSDRRPRRRSSGPRSGATPPPTPSAVLPPARSSPTASSAPATVPCSSPSPSAPVPSPRLGAHARPRRRRRPTPVRGGCAGAVASAERISVCLPSGSRDGAAGPQRPPRGAVRPPASGGYRMLVVQGYPVPVPGAAPPLPSGRQPAPARRSPSLIWATSRRPAIPARRRCRRCASYCKTGRRSAGCRPSPRPAGEVALPQLASDRGCAPPSPPAPLYLDLPWGAGVRGVVQAEPEAGVASQRSFAVPVRRAHLGQPLAGAGHVPLGRPRPARSATGDPRTRRPPGGGAGAGLPQPAGRGPLRPRPGRAGRPGALSPGRGLTGHSPGPPRAG